MLAAAGVYGVTSFTTGQRTREFGVRMTLGAKGRDIMRMVVGEGVTLASAGVIIGILLALPLTRLLQAFLFGVTPLDPLTFLSVVIGLSRLQQPPAMCRPSGRSASIPRRHSGSTDMKITYSMTLVSALACGYHYGFDIMDATNLPSGTVYPILRRLERENMVTSEWEADGVAQSEQRPLRRTTRSRPRGRRFSKGQRNAIGRWRDYATKCARTASRAGTRLTMANPRRDPLAVRVSMALFRHQSSRAVGHSPRLATRVGRRFVTAGRPWREGARCAGRIRPTSSVDRLVRSAMRPGCDSSSPPTTTSCAMCTTPCACSVAGR